MGSHRQKDSMADHTLRESNVAALCDPAAVCCVLDNLNLSILYNTREFSATWNNSLNVKPKQRNEMKIKERNKRKLEKYIFQNKDHLKMIHPDKCYASKNKSNLCSSVQFLWVQNFRTIGTISSELHPLGLKKKTTKKTDWNLMVSEHCDLTHTNTHTHTHTHTHTKQKLHIQYDDILIRIQKFKFPVSYIYFLNSCFTFEK